MYTKVYMYYVYTLKKTLSTNVCTQKTENFISCTNSDIFVAHVVTEQTQCDQALLTSFFHFV